jgi:pimeloyl-ACP methyl ester carboxylesterase
MGLLPVIEMASERRRLNGEVRTDCALAAVTNQKPFGLGTRAVFAATAVGIVTLVVNVVAIGAIKAGNAPTGRLSNPTASTIAVTSTTSTTSSTRLTPVPPYAVEHETINLVDPSRVTPARGDVPAHAGRVLSTVISRPIGGSGPLPLVVFAHGWNSNPTVYEPLLDAWASAGYLVAAPTFPDSANTLPGSPVSNYPAQARDISFVITSLLAGSAGPVDPTRIAVAGHSDGGTDIALLALNPSYADPRVRAYLSLSGEIPSGIPGPWGTPTSGALLVAVGTDDEYGLFPRATQVFKAADVASKVLLTVSGGDHLGMYIGVSAEAMVVREETVRFLDASLQPEGATLAQLTSTLDPTGDPSISVTASPSG